MILIQIQTENISILRIAVKFDRGLDGKPKFTDRINDLWLFFDYLSQRWPKTWKAGRINNSIRRQWKRMIFLPYFWTLSNYSQQHLASTKTSNSRTAQQEPSNSYCGSLQSRKLNPRNYKAVTKGETVKSKAMATKSSKSKPSWKLVRKIGNRKTRKIKAR